MNKENEPQTVEEAHCPTDKKMCSNEYCLAFHKCEKSQITIYPLKGIELEALNKARMQTPFRTKSDSLMWQDGFIFGAQWQQSKQSAEVERLKKACTELLEFVKDVMPSCLVGDQQLEYVTNLAKEALKDKQE